MGQRGPKPAPASELYFFAELFYRDFRRLAEGTSRTRVDRKRYDRISRELKKLRPSLDDPANSYPAQASTDGGERDGVNEDLQQIQRWTEDLDQHRQASEEALVELKVPGEPDVLKDLLAADTPEKIRRICKDAFVLRREEVRTGDFRDLRVANWPISNGSTFPHYLAKHAEQFLAAKRDPRFPQSDRPSNQLKQLWFLSRALAGACFNVSTRTAINLVGSMRPEQLFEESGAAKPPRSRRKL